VIAIYRQGGGRFRTREIALLQNFAAQAVICNGERAADQPKQREALEQQTATAEVLGSSTARGDLAPCSEASSDKAIRPMRAALEGPIFTMANCSMPLRCTEFLATLAGFYEGAVPKRDPTARLLESQMANISST